MLAKSDKRVENRRMAKLCCALEKTVAFNATILTELTLHGKVRWRDPVPNLTKIGQEICKVRVQIR
jgi:hypothetical protein